MTKEALRALVVDDDLATRELVAAALRKHDRVIESTLAEGSDAAAALVATSAFDVAIVDLIMPGKDGFWLIEHLAASQPDLPVLVLTGVQRLEEACRALTLGAWDYLIKPVDVKALGLAVDRALEHRRLLRLERRMAELTGEVESRAGALLERVDPTCSEVVELKAARARASSGDGEGPVARLERAVGLLDRLAELVSAEEG